MSVAVPSKVRKQRDPLNGPMRVWAVLVYIFLFLPIAVIVAFSFNTGRVMESFAGFGLDSFQIAFTDNVILDTVQTSLKAAVGSAILATTLGVFAGIAVVRRPGRWVPFFFVLVFLILVTPEIVDGIALLIWYVRIGGPFGPDVTIPFASYGLIRLWVGHSLFSAAVVTMIVRARLEGLDESLEEAAADLYATPVRRFTQITLPLMLPAVLAGALLSFSFSLDNTIISSFVSTGDATPWAVHVLSAVRSILRPELASMSTLLLLLTLAALGLVALVLRRSGQSGEEVAASITGAA